MYCESYLIEQMNFVKPRLSQEFRRLERWFQRQQKDLEFYVYEDWLDGKPDVTFYVCDILSDEGRHFTIKGKTIMMLFDRLKELRLLVKNKMKIEFQAIS